jgi:NodT family efflux transporter outer membrane factor (OMF) lipoprotein
MFSVHRKWLSFHSSRTFSLLDTRLSRTLIVGLLFITFGGCAYTGTLQDYVHNGFKIGPEYFKPAAPVADQWIDSYDDRIRSEFADDQTWWTVFNDPKLNELVYGAYEQNLPLREAGLRVLQARAQRGIAVGSLFPQAQEMFGSYTHNQFSRETSPGNIPGASRTASTWQTGVDAGWELDFWGKYRRNIEAADADLDSQIENYDESLVVLLADTTSTYVQYRVLQQQLEYTRENVKIQQGSLKIATARFQGEQTSELDVLQATTNLKNTERSIPVLENQLRIVNNSLCTLLGMPPRDLSPELGSGPIPVSPATVAVGVPANLLRRRPDVLAAEREVAAQSARIGVAAADWFPSVQITGSMGYGAGELDQLFTQPAFTGFISPQFNWPILNYGRILRNVQVQDALFQQAAVNYQQTVLSANAEAENAINSFLKAQQALVETQASADAAEKSVQIAIAQYQNGATNYNTVFNLQLILVEEQNALSATQGEISQALISIYKALGGGWQIRYDGFATEAYFASAEGDPADGEGEPVPAPGSVPLDPPPSPPVVDPESLPIPMP